MSVTVSALPFFLLFSLGSGIIEVAKAAKNSRSLNNNSIHLEQSFIDNIVDKEFKTTFQDKNTLLKTLDEHGAQNITEDKNNISCDCENFHLEFYKDGNNPYFMVITFNQKENVSELVNNIENEYKINVQELSYNKIKERLEEKNLLIQDEEVLDDNTIILTINLE